MMGMGCSFTERAARQRTSLQLLGWHRPTRDSQRTSWRYSHIMIPQALESGRPASLLPALPLGVGNSANFVTLQGSNKVE